MLYFNDHISQISDAKISGTKRLNNQNLTETEKSASQPPESAFETISEASAHLLQTSRLRRQYDRKMQRINARIIRACIYFNLRQY